MNIPFIENLVLTIIAPFASMLIRNTPGSFGERAQSRSAMTGSCFLGAFA